MWKEPPKFLKASRSHQRSDLMRPAKDNVARIHPMSACSNLMDFGIHEFPEKLNLMVDWWVLYHFTPSFCWFQTKTETIDFFSSTHWYSNKHGFFDNPPSSSMILTWKNLHKNGKDLPLKGHGDQPACCFPRPPEECIPLFMDKLCSSGLRVEPDAARSGDPKGRLSWFRTADLENFRKFTVSSVSFMGNKLQLIGL